MWLGKPDFSFPIFLSPLILLNIKLWISTFLVLPQTYLPKYTVCDIQLNRNRDHVFVGDIITICVILHYNLCFKLNKWTVKVIIPQQRGEGAWGGCNMSYNLNNHTLCLPFLTEVFLEIAPLPQLVSV